MAELNDYVVSLEKELTCSICKDIFKEPKQLHCLHSFCLRCIEKLNETCRSQGQRLTCPTCRSREDGDVSKLRSSFYLDSLKQLILPVMRSRANKPDEKLQLSNCVSCQEQMKLVAFCVQCQGMVCSNCVNVHKKLKQFLDQHQVVMFSDLKQEHVNSYISNQFHCDDKYHAENHKLEYFCEACQKCICQKCCNTTHDNHNKISMEEKAEEVKQLINEDLNQVNRLKQRFVRELDLSKQNIRRVENEIEAAKKEVSDHIQAQIKILKDHENSTLTTLDEMFLEQKEANDEEQSEINTIMQQLDAVHEQGKALQVQSVDHFILQSQLPQRCEELLQTPSVLSSKPNQRNASVRYIPNTQVTLHDLGKVVQSVPDPSCCTIEDSDSSSHEIQLCSDSDSNSLGQYSSSESENEAVDMLNNLDIHGRELFAGRAKKKAESTPEVKAEFDKKGQECMNRFPGVNLYIKNLDDDIDDAQLREEFAAYGTILSAKVMKDDLGNSKGFGFVSFSSLEEATKAVTEMNGRILKLVSKPLYVAFAQRKEEREAKLTAQHMQRVTRLRMHQTAGQQVGQIFPQTAGGFYMPQIQQNTRPFFNPQMQQVRPRWNMQQQQQVRPGMPNMPSTGQVPRARGVRNVAPRGVGPQSGMPQGVQGGSQRMQNVPMNQPPQRMPGGPQMRPQYKFTQSTGNQPTGPGPMPTEQNTRPFFNPQMQQVRPRWNMQQ